MATRPAKVPAIPDLSSTSLDQVVLALKQWVDTRQGAVGDGLDRAVTLRDLVAAGALDADVADRIATGSSAPQVPPATAIDPAVPPTPTHLTATGAITTILLTWTFAQGYTRLSHFEVWRSATDAVGDAVIIAQPGGAVWADLVSAGDKFYYWVRAVSDAGTSPYNAVAGTLGQTSVNNQQVQDAIDSSIDASGLLDQLTIKTSPDGLVSGYGLASTPSADNGSATTFAVLADRFLVGAPAANGIVPVVPFVVQTTPTIVNGVPVAKGVYIADAFIVNGSITNAKIGNLAVDDAKIANVSVAKLLAGQLSVTEFIQSYGFLSGISGFAINGNGTAEFNDVVVRGGVYASYGAIGGNIIDSAGVRSANYSPGYAGWRIDSGGVAEFNEGHFRGTLYGVDGTFSGELQAATGSFKGDISAATGNFSGSVNGATGTFRGGIAVGDYTGYAWPTLGKYGAYLGPGGLLIGNYYNGKYFQVTEDGQVYAPGFSVVNGILTINQANVINTLNIAGQAVTTGIIAATPYYGGGFYIWLNVPATLILFASNDPTKGFFVGDSTTVYVNGVGVARPYGRTVIIGYDSGDKGIPIYGTVYPPDFGVVQAPAGNVYVNTAPYGCLVAVLVLRR